MKILVQHSQKSTPVDVLLFPYVEKKKIAGKAKEIDDALQGWMNALMKDQDFTGKSGQILIVQTQNRFPAKRIVLMGMGEKKEINQNTVRQAFGLAFQSFYSFGVETVGVLHDDIADLFDAQESASAAVEGMGLAAYEFSKYQPSKKKEKKKKIVSCTFFAPDESSVKKMKKGGAQGKIFVDATIRARDLINEPAMHLKPSALVKEAREIAKKEGVKITVFNEAQMKKLGMGAILAVSAGSDEEAYFVHLQYTPKKKTKKKIAICGKGITFDSGGLSLKPTNYMDTMKMDMAGAANILGFFSQIQNIAPSVEVHGVFAVTENMPSGKATKPGDVITSYKGITIEVTNTDAEGRLILSDTLAWTEKVIQPDMIIDYATLTGAAIIALGADMAAILGSADVVKPYMEASQQAGEPMWELPMHPEYKKFLKSPIADCANSYKGMGPDTIVAALFLEQFIEKTPWAHIDIAGPAWVDHPVRSYTPIGATGFGVRSLIHFVQNYS